MSETSENNSYFIAESVIKFEWQSYNLYSHHSLFSNLHILI